MLNGSRLGSLCWRLRCSAAAVNVRQDLLRKTWPQAPPEWIEEAEAKALLQPHLESPDLEDALAAVLTASTAYPVPSPAKEFVRTRTLLSLVEPCDAHVLEVTLDSLQFASVGGDEHLSHAYHVRFRLSGAGPWVNSPTFVVHDDAAEGPVEVQMGTAVRFVVPLSGGDSLTHLFKGVFAIGLELQLREESRESSRASTILQGELAAAELHALCADVDESDGHGSFRSQLRLSRPGVSLRPCLLSCSAAASQGDWLGDHVSLSLRFARAVAALDASPWPCEAQAQAVAVGPEDGLGIPGLRVSVERFFASLVDDPRPAGVEEPPPLSGRPESGTEGIEWDAWEELDDLPVLGSPTPRSPDRAQASPTSSARSLVKDEPSHGDDLQDLRSSLQASVDTGEAQDSPMKLSPAWPAAKSAEVSPARRSMTQRLSLDAGGLDDSPLTSLMTKPAATTRLDETDEALGSFPATEAADSPFRESPHRASWPAAEPRDVKDPLPAEAEATEVVASKAAGLPLQMFIADEMLPPAAQLRGDLAQRIAELDQLQHSLLARIGVDKSDAAPSDTFKKSGEADDVDETDAAPHEESRKESDGAGFPLLSGHGVESPSSKESARELPDEPEPACEESLGGPDADDSRRPEGDSQARTATRELPARGRPVQVSAFKGAGAPPPRTKVVEATPQHLLVPIQASGRLLSTLEPEPGWAQLVEGKPSGLALGGRGPLPVSLSADAQESRSLGAETSAGRCRESGLQEPISLHSPAPTELPKTSLGLGRKSPETAQTAPTTALTAMSEAACQTTWSSSIASEVLSWTPFRSPASARLAETQRTATATSLATSPPRQFPPRPPLWSPATTPQPSPDRSQESPTLRLSGAVPSAATTAVPGARTRIQLAMKWSDRLDEKTKRLAKIMHGRKRRGDHDEDSWSSDS